MSGSDDVDIAGTSFLPFFAITAIITSYFPLVQPPKYYNVQRRQ